MEMQPVPHITRVNGNGWTNLDTHVFEKHTDYKEKLAEFQRSNSKGILLSLMLRVKMRRIFMIGSSGW